MNRKFRPLSNRVLIKAEEVETKTSSGIFIPDTAKEKPQRGLVIEVGKGRKDEPMTVSVGDLVIFGKYAGAEIEHNGDKYLLMSEDDILAII